MVDHANQESPIPHNDRPPRPLRPRRASISVAFRSAALLKTQVPIELLVLPAERELSLGEGRAIITEPIGARGRIHYTERSIDPHLSIRRLGK